jgi:hypothetical protein
VTGPPLPCPEARALRDSALDGPLAAADEVALRAHEAVCAACASAALAGDAGPDRRLERALRGLEPLPPPDPAFVARVLGALDRSPGRDAAVEAESPPPAAAPTASGRWRTLGPAGVAAVVAAALGALPASLGAPSLPGAGSLIEALRGSLSALVPSAGSLAPPSLASLASPLADPLAAAVALACAAAAAVPTWRALGGARRRGDAAAA